MFDVAKRGLDYQRPSREAKFIYVRLNTQTPILNRDCPGSPSVAWELFTLTTRFAFSNGCDGSAMSPFCLREPGVLAKARDVEAVTGGHCRDAVGRGLSPRGRFRSERDLGGMTDPGGQWTSRK